MQTRTPAPPVRCDIELAEPLVSCVWVYVLTYLMYVCGAIYKALSATLSVLVYRMEGSYLFIGLGIRLIRVPMYIY